MGQTKSRVLYKWRGPIALHNLEFFQSLATFPVGTVEYNLCHTKPYLRRSNFANMPKGENTKKAAGNAQKAEVAAQKKAVEDQKKATEESAKWNKGAKDSSKAYVTISSLLKTPC